MFIQMTGLPCAGKTTIAKAVAERLRENNYPAEIIDGDEFRKIINDDLSFTKENRTKNIKRLAYIAHLLSRNDIIVIMAVINPYAELRQQVAEEYNAKTVFINCSLQVCEERDVKGLYKKAREGEIADFTGISSSFDVPQHADLIINTEIDTITQSVKQLEDYILTFSPSKTKMRVSSLEMSTQ